LSYSIVVPIDNRPELTSYFFAHLKNATKFASYELVLVSDDCRDVRVLKQLRAAERDLGAKLTLLDHKVGYGRAANIGVAESTGDTIVFLNSDVFPDVGALDILVNEVNNSQEIGAVQGLLIYPQTGRVQSTGHVFGKFVNYHALEGRSTQDPLVLKTQQRQGLTAAMYAVRREVFLTHGGFDEFFYNAWEGLDFTLRLTHSGMRCLYLPSARAHHVRNASRRHYRFDETQQIGYFWSKWGTRIRSDVSDLISTQVRDEHRKAGYLAVHCGSTEDWTELAAGIGLEILDRLEVPDRFDPQISLYDNLPHAIHQYAGRLLFVADHFEQLAGNQEWVESRNRLHDLIIDLRGNLMSTPEIHRSPLITRSSDQSEI
jgi:GT2 family glycosyltransferase